MKRSSLLIFLLFLFVSCQDNMEISQVQKRTERNAYTSKDPNLLLKKKFGQALATLMANNQSVREFIRNQALKQINYDYDVVYELVKNIPISGKSTLESLLSQYLPQGELILVKEQIPTLTIFVPELPKNSFSAELWDIEHEIPLVGIRTHATNNVPIFNSAGVESYLEEDIVPHYPIVVIKENERIVAYPSRLSSKSFTLKSITNITKSTSDIDLYFIDEIFNNVSPQTKAAEPKLIIPQNLEKVYEAYNIYKDSSGWQRDYIYYNITPTHSKGPFQLNYKECICEFELLGDGMTAYRKIADQGEDPHVNENLKNACPGRGHPRNGWTDGEFEFAVKCYLISTNGNESEILTFLELNQMNYLI